MTVSMDSKVAAAPFSILTLPGLMLLPMPKDTQKPFLFIAGTLLQGSRSEEECLMLFERSLTLGQAASLLRRAMGYTC